MTAISMWQLPTYVYRNEERMPGTDEIAHAEVVTESGEEPLSDDVMMREEASKSNHNSGMNVLNNMSLEPRYPQRVRNAPIQSSINALKTVRDKNKPTLRKSLTGRENEEWKAVVNSKIAMLHELEC